MYLTDSFRLIIFNLKLFVFCAFIYFIIIVLFVSSGIVIQQVNKTLKGEFIYLLIS